MSDIGGDLESMRTTARRFGTAGDTFGLKLEDLSKRMTDAAARFLETAQQALTETNTLTADVDTEMRGLREQGESTAWRGTNKDRFVGDVTAFQSKLVDGTTRMRTFVEQVKGQVAGPMHTEIAEFSGEVLTAGTSARDIATAFNAAVESQAKALDSAMNQGWTSG